MGRSLEEWVLDIPNLWIQGIIIPLMHTYILYKFYYYFIPSYQNSITISFWPGLIFNLFIVDYIYYWNHRLFHTKKFWPIHLVHHTAKQMDVLVTSRNTVWTSFFIVYIWVNSLMIYLLDNPQGYIIGITITSCLDLWRHSNFFPKHSPLQNFLARKLFIITPVDHSWHHSSELRSNFGANFNIFDKIHGTYEFHSYAPKVIGISTNLTLLQKLFNPFRSGK